MKFKYKLNCSSTSLRPNKSRITTRAKKHKETSEKKKQRKGGKVDHFIKESPLAQ